MEYRDTNRISKYIIEKPACGLDSILAGGIWKDVLSGCIPCPGLDEGFGLPGMNAFCFFGPVGTGKLTTALAFAGSIPEEMYRDNGYRTFLVPGQELEAADAAQTRQNIHALFEEALKGASVVILDQLRNDLQWEAVAEECLCCQDAQNLTVFVIEKDGSRIREEYQRAMMMCGFELPSYQERLEFFRRPENGMPRRGGQPREETLAECTEGMNYIQLKNLVKMVRLRVKAKAVGAYGRDPDRIFSEYQNGNVYYTRTEFEEYRDLLKIDFPAPGGSEESGRLRVFLENAPAAFGDMGGGTPLQPLNTGGEQKQILKTDAEIERELLDL